MKKNAALTLLFAFCLSAQASEWRKIVARADFDAYVDVSRVRWSGEIASVWKLMDYRRPQQEENFIYSSGKVHTEHDCARERLRTTYVIVYATELGMGEVVTAVDKSQSRWQRVIPGSVGESVHQFICNWKPFLGPT